MKILELAPYIFIEGHPHGKRNKSGLAYMVRSICDMLASENDVHVLTQSVLSSEMTINGWKLVRRSYYTIFRSFKYRYLRLAFSLFKKEKTVGLPRILLYCISAGQVEDYIRKWKPEVIHIHGIGIYTLPYYLAASICEIPLVSTLHGLLSFCDTITIASPFAQRLERLFLEMCVMHGYTITCVSTGIKQRIINEINNIEANIIAIPNCCRFPKQDNKKRNEVSSTVKHVICVGNNSERKNQIQVIRAMPLVRKKLMRKVDVILDLLGGGDKIDEWENYCKENRIDNINFKGVVPQDTVFATLRNSDLLVLASIDEGFGIPIIEAYNCGTPVVTFRDLDAAQDIANEDCCVFAANRSDEALADAIVDALNREWNEEKIKAFAQNFTFEAIAKKYCNVLAMQHKVWDVKIIEKLIKELSNQ